MAEHDCTVVVAAASNSASSSTTTETCGYNSSMPWTSKNRAFPWWEVRQQRGTGSIARVEGPNKSAGLAAAMAALEAGIDIESVAALRGRRSRLSPVVSSRERSRQ
jgi:hypothetical protein